MASYFRTAALLVAIACTAACTKAPSSTAGDDKTSGLSPAAAAMTPKQRNSYMVGMDVGKSLEPIKDEIDLVTLNRAMQDVFAGKKTKLAQAEADQIRTEFSAMLQEKMKAKAEAEAKANIKAGADFLAKNKEKPGVRSTTSGLQYQVLREGSGPKPLPTDLVRVNYLGTTLDGKKFDSSYDRGEPVTFPLNQVIPGWTEGVGLMPVGAKYKFWVPGNLGYGEAGMPPSIAPNATLVFEVELLEIVKQ